MQTRWSEKPLHCLIRRLARRSPLGTVRAANDDGLTLLECLAAIVVVGMVGASIAPVLVLSVATRIQSQKAEQAIALAQGEVDRIRVLVEQGSDDDFTAAVDSLPLDTTATSIQTVAAPTAPATPITQANIANFDQITETVAVDIDDDGEFDFAVQRFRKMVADPADNTIPVEEGLIVGVRVYDYQAVTDGSNLGIEEGSVGLTSGSGDRLNAPLATLYSTVFRSSQGTALCNYIDFTTSSGSTGIAKPQGCN